MESETTATSYQHGWNACCRGKDACSEVTRHGDWVLRTNPGYWGSTNPEVVVLGFSKGANQIRAAISGDFDGIAFAGARPRLKQVLTTLGLLAHDEDIDQALTASGRKLGVASLLRCGLSREVGGKLKTSGDVIKRAVKDSWARQTISRCIRHHLPQLPLSVRKVVLLGNDDDYVDAVKSMVSEAFADYREVNRMAFRARGITWVFAAHPSPLNGHFPRWIAGEEDVQGHKCQLACVALGATADGGVVPVSGQLYLGPEKRESPSKPQGRPSSRKDRYASTFYLVGVRGEAIFPVRVTRRSTGNCAFLLSKRGTDSHHDVNVIEVDDEQMACDMVASGTYKIRAIRKGERAPSLLGLGDRAVSGIVKV
jgi:hypothetical protein